jgi:hypothetical protein
MTGSRVPSPFSTPTNTHTHTHTHKHTHTHTTHTPHGHAHAHRHAHARAHALSKPKCPCCCTSLPPNDSLVHPLSPSLPLPPGPRRVPMVAVWVSGWASWGWQESRRGKGWQWPLWPTWGGHYGWGAESRAAMSQKPFPGGDHFPPPHGGVLLKGGNECRWPRE